MIATHRCRHCSCPTDDVSDRGEGGFRRGLPIDFEPAGDKRYMKTSQFLLASALAAALAMPNTAQAGPAPQPKFQAEKCYGIAKAGTNDCQTANSSCAGTSH